MCFVIPFCTLRMETFEKFVRSFLAGDLEPYLKSEPIPADNSGPVKVSTLRIPL